MAVGVGELVVGGECAFGVGDFRVPDAEMSGDPPCISWTMVLSRGAVTSAFGADVTDVTGAL